MPEFIIATTVSHKQDDGTTFIELKDEEQTIVATILVADPKIAQVSVKKDGQFVPVGTFPIYELLGMIQTVLDGDCTPQTLDLKPLN